MEKDIKQILELVQRINYKCDDLEKENLRLQNKNDRILKRLDELERDVSNVPQTQSNILDNQQLTIKMILEQYPHMKKSTLYRIFQNHRNNGLNVVQKDEGGTYTVKRKDWEDWYNNMLSVSTDILDLDSQISDILNQDDDIDLSVKVEEVKKIIEKKSKLSNVSNIIDKEFEFNL